MLKTKLFTAIAMVATLLLLAPAAYAAEGTTTGSFGAASKPPVVDDIEIYQDFACTTVATSMDPQTTYYAKVTVTSHNKLKHLDEVKVTIFYDTTGGDMPAPVAGDTHDCAILTCTVGPPASWAIDSGGPPTTWSIVTVGGDQCTQPADLNTTTGDWIFSFIPGKVARENTVNDWDAQGKATNKQPQSGELYVRDKDMNWYGEIAVNTPSVDWGAVPLGLVFENDTYNPETSIDVDYIANGDYSEDIRSSDNWTGQVSLDVVTLDVTGGNPPAADSQFALEANDTSDNVTAITVTNTYNSIDNTGQMTSEDGDNVPGNTLWLSISTAGIVPDTYEGDIYYQISNR
jgi:hypothetical protein